MGDNLPDPFSNDIPWLTVIGYNSWLINPVDDEGTQYVPVTTEPGPINEIRLRERGYIDNYDFTVGTTIGNVLNLGFALSIKDISYSLTSDYLEDFNKGGYTLTNWLTTNGAGVSAKIGIYRPVNELRPGLAYHTPMVRSTETYEAQIDDDMGAYITDPIINRPNQLEVIYQRLRPENARQAGGQHRYGIGKPFHCQSRLRDDGLL